eukprot:RCo052293
MAGSILLLVASLAALIRVVALPTNGSSAAQTLNGSAPSLVLPLLQAWAPGFLGSSKVSVQVGPSTPQGLSAELDFAVTLDPSAWVDSPGTVLVPFAVVPLVVTYNIPNLTSPLNVSRGLLADIWAGNVRQWSDSAVRALNPDLNVSADIVVVVPQGSSSSTLVFTAALCSFNATWKVKFGAFSNSSDFARSSANFTYTDQSGAAATIPFALSYVPLLNVITQGATFARMVNSYGVLTFPLPAPIIDGLRSVTLSSNLTASVVDLPEMSAYPLLGLSYLQLRLNSADCDRQQRLFDFVNWVLTSSTAAATTLSLGYFPLPAELTTAALYRLTAGLTCAGP